MLHYFEDFVDLTGPGELDIKNSNFAFQRKQHFVSIDALIYNSPEPARSTKSSK